MTEQEFTYDFVQNIEEDNVRFAMKVILWSRRVGLDIQPFLESDEFDTQKWMSAFIQQCEASDWANADVRHRAANAVRALLENSCTSPYDSVC